MRLVLFYDTENRSLGVESPEAPHSFNQKASNETANPAAKRKSTTWKFDVGNTGVRVQIQETQK